MDIAIIRPLEAVGGPPSADPMGPSLYFGPRSDQSGLEKTEKQVGPRESLIRGPKLRKQITRLARQPPFCLLPEFC